jgi:hypothetical protein
MSIPARGLPGLVLVIAGFLLVSCATTQVVSSWKDPEFQGPPLHNVVVFVAARDEEARRVAENEALRNLPPGVRGTASHTLFPDQKVLGGDRGEGQEAVKKRLIEMGFDAALVARLVSVDEKQVYVPPQVHIVPARPGFGAQPYYGSFYGYYGYAYGGAYTSPGQTYETTRYVVETIVYGLPSGKPIWTGSVESTDPDSRSQLAREMAKVVGQELVQAGVLAGKS